MARVSDTYAAKLKLAQKAEQIEASNQAYNSLKKPKAGRATGYGDSVGDESRGTAATMLGSDRATTAADRQSRYDTLAGGNAGRFTRNMDLGQIDGADK